MKPSEFAVGCLIVRLNAIAENYRICRRFGSGAAVAGVVKADGYGLGATEVTRALSAEGCDTFFVARLEEGMALRPVVPEARIFVLDGVSRQTISALVAHNLTPVLNTLDEIALWSETARGRDAGVHIDTGMNRLGIPVAEVGSLAAKPGPLASFNLVLIMSHLASADDFDSPMNARQLDRFRSALAMLPRAPASLAASGGILLGPAYAFDMVRPGIALYGGNPQPGRANPFLTAAQLTGRILQLRRVDKGESVGYGATFRVERPAMLATAGLGYADGLMRALGNRGGGAISGYKAPIVGRVSMDLVTLDVTDIPGRLLFPGADVEFLGDTVLLDEVAAQAGTASYEILTSLGTRVRRIHAR